MLESKNNLKDESKENDSMYYLFDNSGIILNLELRGKPCRELVIKNK